MWYGYYETILGLEYQPDTMNNKELWVKSVLILSQIIEMSCSIISS